MLVDESRTIARVDNFKGVLTYVTMDVYCKNSHLP